MAFGGGPERAEQVLAKICIVCTNPYSVEKISQASAILSNYLCTHFHCLGLDYGVYICEGRKVHYGLLVMPEYG